MSPDQNVFQHCHFIEKLDILKCAGDAPFGDLMGFQRNQIFALQQNPAAVWSVKRVDNVEDGRFAGSVGADKRKYFAVSDLKRAVVDSLQSAKAD